MKSAASILSFFIVFLSGSCSQPEEEKRVAIPPTLLHGRWQAVYFKVEMPSYKNSDSTHTIEVNESNWEKSMGMRPMLYFFWPDSSFNILHYNLQDSLVMNPAGWYRLQTDTLIMQDTLPVKGDIYRYHLRIRNNMAEFRGLEDSDADGVKDDHYYGTFRKYVPR